MIYLATNFSHPEPVLRKRRYKQALWLTNYYLEQKLIVFSPIVHGYWITEAFSPEKYRAVHWENYNNAMIKESRALIFHTLDDMNPSKGVEKEIALAKSLPITVEESFVQIPDSYNIDDEVYLHDA